MISGTVAGNGRSQLVKAAYISKTTNTLWKNMHPTIFLTAMDEHLG